MKKYHNLAKGPLFIDDQTVHPGTEFESDNEEVMAGLIRGGIIEEVLPPPAPVAPKPRKKAKPVKPAPAKPNSTKSKAPEVSAKDDTKPEPKTPAKKPAAKTTSKTANRKKG